MSAPYQVMPPLTAIEMAELRASIETHGVQVPVLVDENNIIIDGHHRQQIAAELGIDYPCEVRDGLSDDQKRALAYTLNSARRHLTREQKQNLIAAHLRLTPERSDNQIAKDVGVHHTTVGTIRSKLEASGDVAKLATRTDTHGRQQPAKKSETGKSAATIADEVAVPKKRTPKSGTPIHLTQSQRACIAVELLDLVESNLIRPFMGEVPDSLLALADDGTDMKAAFAGWVMMALNFMNAGSFDDTEVAGRLINECAQHGMDLRAFLLGAIYRSLLLLDQLPPEPKRRRKTDHLADVESAS